MDNFSQFLMTNPQFRMGLEMMSGATPSQIQQNEMNRAKLQAFQQEQARAQKRNEILGRMGQGDDVMRELLAVDPEMAIRFQEMQLKGRQQSRLERAQQMQEGLMQGLLSGEDMGEQLGGNVAPYILSGSDDPIMRGIGEAKIAELQRQQKLEDEQRKQEIKPATEAQAKAAGFASRMAQTEEILTPLEQQGVSSANLGSMAAEGSLFGLGNYLTSEDFKKYRQAQQNWVRANLRKESGAVIGEDEMRDEITTYFPVPGDTPAVIEQKRKARAMAFEAVKAGAKPGDVQKIVKQIFNNDNPSQKGGKSSAVQELLRRGYTEDDLRARGLIN